MFASTLSAARPAPPPDVAAFVYRIVANCLDISAVWSIGHDPQACDALEPRRLLAFADHAILQRLRRSEHLHHDAIELHVVVDGDLFETAWGPQKLSGSLARWAWSQTSPHEAYYNEARWAQDMGAGAVVRVRRKALLVWQSADAADD
jgi:hypothetical protein